MRISSILLCGACLTAYTAAPALAQTEPQESEGIADIVVTAQKRAENLQNVPISVSAVGGEQLANMQVTTLQALQGSVPNVQIDNFANTPNNAVFTIRGIGVIEPDPYAGNTVSIVVDGVPQFFSMGALLDMYDVNRVEILRGPQGTLFGANTTGGVVNVVTSQPTGEFGGYVKAMVGNWNRVDISGAIEAPLAKDILSLKLSGIHTQRKGWVTNVFDGSDMGSKNIDAVRAQLLFTPAPNVKMTLQGEYVAARNGAPIVINGAVPGEANYVAPGVSYNGSVLPMYASPCLPAGTRCEAPGKYYSGNNEVPDTSDMDTYFTILTTEIGDTALGDITSITGYKTFKLFEYTDQDGSPKTNNATRRQTKGWQFSQELRSAFSLGEAFTGVAGLFYLKTHYDHYQMYHLDFAAPGLAQYNTQEQGTESVSAFLQTYYQATDRLKFQGGIRFTHDRINARSTLDYAMNLPALTSDDFAVAPGIGDLNDVAHQIDTGGRKSWDNVGWKLGFDYELGAHQMVYGSWARGFKSGGFTGRIGVVQDGDTPYGPEKVDTFEVGLKADLLDRRLRVNLAAFYTNYRDMQVAQIYFDSATNVQGNRILNAAKAEIKGVELEVQAMPTDGLTLRGSVGYLDTKYKEFLYFDPVSAVVYDLKGEALQNAPKWAGTLGANYSLELAGGSKIVADLSYQYTSKKFYTAILNTPRSEIQPTHYVDALLTWHAADDNIQVGLWAKNLFDKRYISTSYDSPGYAALVGYAPPRQFGVSATYNF
ncbi:iron complex outermembrane receptor protein [Sphingobium fontiphilum]|uniref:Iron complex outermembrane receptor protein n=1 Tax=Sphingobium fontiphilum TaxID=944425 RepID=A0A7W6GMC7_9SPHN|nr:TonB-dependent receptor [Sphingobium fontiphilum]MBB3981061.1 iron complex outermembrane receptor protein [Sphingobium fontiphilum]